jgi:aminopeptidase
MTFEQQLEALAAVTVRVGNNVQAGQRLFVRAPLESAPLARLIVREAYKVGARMVEVLWTNDQITLERLRHSKEEFLNESPETMFHARDSVAKNGDAYLSILADDPGVFEYEDTARVTMMTRAVSARARASSEAFGAGAVNWSIVACAVPKWAARVFPDLEPEEAVARLWTAIFTASRADQPDPVAAWTAHLDALEARRNFLNTQGLRSVEFRAPGTDLRVELPEAHRWEGGSGQTNSGIRYVPNIPTEEVFTIPHRLGVNGTARASKPLGYSGKVIEGIEMTFKDGLVTHATARTNADTLHDLLKTDEGASRLGEVALVASSSPVARSGLLFQETLFDENAACHIGLGRAYKFTLNGGKEMSNDEFVTAGGNLSNVHVDWMIGTPDMEVTGIKANGERLKLLEAGEWAF